MIPMINVVFLLLAFFMIAGQIERSDAVRLEAPESISRESQGEYTATLLIAASDSLYLDDRPLRAEQLTGEIRRILQTSADPQSVRVLVKADALLPATELCAVLTRLRIAGLLRVSLATQSAANQDV